MESVLETLCSEAWVRGSMIVSDEGMVVVERIAQDLDRDAIAALATDLVTEVSDGLKEAALQPFTRIVLSAKRDQLLLQAVHAGRHGVRRLGERRRRGGTDCQETAEQDENTFHGPSEWGERYIPMNTSGT